MIKNPHILLRSSWQIVNIGDIAHTPGVLALLEKNLPDYEVILWASDEISLEVKEMEQKRFPNLKIVLGTIDENGNCTTKELEEAIAWSDFLLHGSGPFLVAAPEVKNYINATKKPFGVFGITYGMGVNDDVGLLSQAEFIFFRDSVSLKKAKDDGINCPIMEFGPDGAFSTDVLDDEKAIAFLKENNLEEKKFICCIPKLRYTPYWKIKDMPFDEERHQRNEQMKENDHFQLRQAIIEIARNTDVKVLICPEDLTQIEVGKEMLYDKLPADVLDRVVLKEEFWLTDEANSVYIRSLGLFGNEQHSPIMCIANGVPAIVCRWNEQSSKGFMWKDINLSEWLFDLDSDIDVSLFVKTVMEIVNNNDLAVKKAQKALEYVQKIQKRMTDVLDETIKNK